MANKNEHNKTNPFARQWELLQAIRMREEDQAQRLMAKTELNPPLIKDQLLAWLEQFPMPRGSIDGSWGETIKDYTTGDSTIPQEIMDLGVLFAVPLYTIRERYLLLIKGCQQSDVKGMGIMSVSIDRQTTSLKMHAKLADAYHTAGTPPPMPVHTLWIENFHQDDLLPVLNNCGLAILGNELISKLAAEKDATAFSGSPDAQARARALQVASEEEELIARFRDLAPDVRDAMLTLLFEHHAEDSVAE